MRFAVPLILAMLTLTGCSTEIAGVASPAPGATKVEKTEKVESAGSAATTPSVIDLRDRLMIKVIREGTSITPAQIPDARMPGVATFVCGWVGVHQNHDGVTTAIVEVSSANAVSLPDAGFVVGASIANKCPQYTYLIEK